MLKRFRLFILVLITILWFFIILPYLLVQTNIGSHYASQLISHYSDNYTISIGKISHSIFKPYAIELNDITVESKIENKSYLSAQKIVIVLNKNDLLTTDAIDYVLIENGSINYAKEIEQLKLNINFLQLKNTSLDYIDKIDGSTITFSNISGQISPWSTQLIHHRNDSQFTLTIEKIISNQLNVQAIFIQGKQHNKQINITNFGGNIDRGFFTMKGTIEPDNTLNIPQLRINKINILSDTNLTAFKQISSQFNRINIGQISILESSFVSTDLMIEKGNLAAKNIYYDGNWQLDRSDLTFSAESLIWHDELLVTPLLQWNYEHNNIIIEQGMAAWMDGHVQFSGNWAANQLTLDHILIDGIRYQLPNKWLEKLNTTTLPDFVPNQIEIKQLTLMPSLIIDTDPYLPFQFTAFEAFGNDIKINHLKDNLNVEGTILLKADNGTLNTIELSKPDLTLKLTPANYQLIFSSLVDQGIIDGKANLLATKQLQSLSVNAYNVDSKILSLWHLVNNPIKTEKYSVELSGYLEPISLSGQLKTNDKTYLIKNNQLLISENKPSLY